MPARISPLARALASTAACALALAVSCHATPRANEPAALPPRVDAAGEWGRASPEALGFDAARLREGTAALRAQPGTRALVVVRHGRIAHEEAWRGRLSAPHDIKSGSKSLLGLVVGVALENGTLESLSQPIADYLPQLHAEGVDPRKRRITLEHLLTMSSGLASTSGEHYGAWVSSGDWVAGALERPILSEPGESFLYSTGNTHLLSAILTQATGQRLDELAREWVLGPIGADFASWQLSPKGLAFGGNSLSMDARDLARFGQLVLQRGSWGERRVVPAAWIEASTQPHAEGWPDRYGPYGRLFWIPPGFEGASLAVGYGGQFVLISPPHDTVVVLLSSHAGKGAAWDARVLSILRDDILGAAKPR